MKVCKNCNSKCENSQDFCFNCLSTDFDKISTKKLMGFSKKFSINNLIFSLLIFPLLLLIIINLITTPFHFNDYFILSIYFISGIFFYNYSEKIVDLVASFFIDSPNTFSISDTGELICKCIGIFNLIKCYYFIFTIN